MNQATDSVLALHMGDAFSRLSPLLQRAHLGNNRLRGVARVSQGNVFARALCHLFHFPRASTQVQLSVDCYHDAYSMRWHRNFDGLKMQSQFRRAGEHLIEYLGPLAMRFKAIEKDGQLHYDFVGTRFLGIPLPYFLSPHISADEREVDGEYRFSVAVSMCLIGQVIAYSGELNVEPLA